MNHKFFAEGMTKPTTIQPIAPAIATIISMVGLEIKKMILTLTIVAINKIINIRFFMVIPPRWVYSLIYLPRNERSSHACKRGELL